MSQYLPYGGFKWLNQKVIDKFEVNSTECNSVEENSSVGYILTLNILMNCMNWIIIIH